MNWYSPDTPLRHVKGSTPLLTTRPTLDISGNPSHRKRRNSCLMSQSVLFPCDQCSAVLLCEGCRHMHQRDHMVALLAAGPRRLAPINAPAITPFAIPRRHLRVFPWHTNTDRHTCDELDQQGLPRAQTHLRWYNLTFVALLKMELHRVAQTGLLRICRPLQHVPLRVQGLTEHILQFAGSKLRPHLIHEVTLLRPLQPGASGNLSCATRCLEIACINKPCFYCCSCAQAFCHMHHKSCGCVGVKQPFRARCQTCREGTDATPRCKHCTARLYFISSKDHLLCSKCCRSWRDEVEASQHESLCLTSSK